MALSERSSESTTHLSSYIYPVLVLRLLSYMCTFAKQPAVEFSYIPIPLPWNGRGPFTDFLSQDISLVFGPQTEVVKSENGRAKFPWRGANPSHEEACQPTTALSRHLGTGTSHEDSSMKYNRSCLHVRLPVCCRDGEAMRFQFLLKALYEL